MAQISDEHKLHAPPNVLEHQQRHGGKCDGCDAGGHRDVPRLEKALKLLFGPRAVLREDGPRGKRADARVKNQTILRPDENTGQRGGTFW